MDRNNQISRRNFLGKLSAGTIGIAASGIITENLYAAQNSTSEQWEQTSERKIRVGIVGGGFGAGFFWNQHPNCIVEAVSDLQEERKRTLMEVYKCAKSYDSLEKLVLDKKMAGQKKEFDWFMVLC